MYTQGTARVLILTKYDHETDPCSSMIYKTMILINVFNYKRLLMIIMRARITEITHEARVLK